MGESRGRKGKKTKWQLQVGIKELVFTGLGVAGLAMMSFALGTLAGRGDIYRVLQNWGLLSPDRGKAVQMWHRPPLPSSTPVTVPSNPPSQETQAPAQISAAEPGPTSPPVKGSIGAAPSPPHAPKKLSKQEAKAKEDKLEKIRREVASKLKFQNSLDLAATRGSKTGGEARKGNDQEPNTASKASTSQVIVAKFRDAERAKTRLSEMRKQGEKVVLKEGKDNDGPYFAIYRQITTSPSRPNHVAPTRLKKNKSQNTPAKTSARSQ